MCERGVWLWLRGGEGRWHVGWRISGRRLAEVGERVRVGGVCGCGCGVARSGGARVALGVDFRWLRVKFPLDWKSGILRA